MRLFLHTLMLLTVLFSGCDMKTGLRTESSRVLRKAADFLWNKQGKDGGWHSETHGLLKIGQVCTPYVLDALMQVPDSIYPIDQNKVRSALDFIKTHTNEEGALGFFDPDLLEYPNYATAFGLKCLFLYGDEEDKAFSGKMKDYLLAQQFDEDRGYSRSHSAFGGWGFGEEYLVPGNPGHVDISHTRRILEALQPCGGLDSATCENAHLFLMRLQKNPKQVVPTEGLLASFDSIRYDGGFIYSPVQEDVNKGGWVYSDSGGTPLYMRSYATATCDGVLALLALEEELSGGEMIWERVGGRKQTKESEAKQTKISSMVQDGYQWLQDHPSWSEPEGIPPDHPQQWHRVMYYYHLSVRAQVYQRLGRGEDWQSVMMKELQGKQAGDGSFSNPEGAPNKENDPLLATAMVVRTLTAGL